MTQTSGPWTPTDPEAPVAPGEVMSNDAWELMLADLVDGIIGTPGSTAYAATATGTRGVSHAAGASLNRAHWHKNSGPEVLSSAANAGSLARVDRSVLRVDRTAKSVTLHLVQGTVGAGAPALTDTDTVTDRPLWQWTVTPGATAVSDLVDQRQWLGSLVRPCTSTNRPVPPRKGLLAVETDTGSLIRYDGTAWVALVEDTGWLTLMLNGKDKGAWNDTDEGMNPLKYKRLNGRVHLRLSIKRVNVQLGLSDSDGSTAYVLPEGFRPNFDSPPVLGYGNHARNGLQLYIYASGEVRVYPLNADLPVGRRIYAQAEFPVS